jgi:hypothetical protein
MKIEKLMNLLNWCLRQAEKADTVRDRERFFHIAFGAVQLAFDHDLPSEVSNIITTAWEEDYRPKFEKLIYG